MIKRKRKLSEEKISAVNSKKDLKTDGAVINSRIQDYLDAAFVVASEACEGSGEDSFCCSCSKESIIAGVFDGCGGLGTRQYDHYENHTGAYIASRLVSGAVYDWFQNSRQVFDRKGETAEAEKERDPNGKNPYEEAIQVLKERIAKALKTGERLGGSTLKIRGSMVRNFPTTAAIALAVCLQDGVELDAMWAGDSRVYFLGETGLMPLTRDDTSSGDAFEDLRNDPVQTNVLSSDGQFILHTRTVPIKEPILVIAATDGYFGYWNTPMEFEYFLLDTLYRSSCLEEWEEFLREEIKDVTGDDATLAVLAFGFGTFDRMKEAYTERHRIIKDQYINQLGDSCTEKEAKLLWQKYRRDYEKYILS